MERQRIATLRRQGLSVRAIAEHLERSPSTISRELRRNVAAHDRGGYDGDLAHAPARERARRPRCGRLRLDAELPNLVQAAAVSGNYVYCARPVERTFDYYQSQIECYPHGCWLDPIDDQTRSSFNRAGWLWIGRVHKIGHPDGPWGARAIHHSVREDPQSEAAAVATLAQGRQIWRSASISELAQMFDDLSGRLPATGTYRMNDADVEATTVARGYQTLALLYRTWQQHG